MSGLFQWVSELDVCLVSSNLVNEIVYYKVIKDVLLPSDHAPISISFLSQSVDIKQILYRASYLGDHAVLHGKDHCKGVRKPIAFRDLDKDKFMQVMAQCEPPAYDDDIDVE